MRHVFEKVSIKRVKRWVEDGSNRQQTREFYQTISPFNVNADGSRKTREQIMVQIKAEADRWMKEERVS